MDQHQHAPRLLASIPVDQWRHFPVPEGTEFVLDNPELTPSERTIRTLDEMSEAINLIDPDTFMRHVNAEKNDFASWVEHVFGEVELANALREYPTPLRMLVLVEKFLRQIPLKMMKAPEAPATNAAPAPLPPMGMSTESQDEEINGRI